MQEAFWKSVSTCHDAPGPSRASGLDDDASDRDMELRFKFQVVQVHEVQVTVESRPGDSDRASDGPVPSRTGRPASHGHGHGERRRNESLYTSGTLGHVISQFLI